MTNLVFTSVASNYIPMARLMFESLSIAHPDWYTVLFLSDDPPEGFDINDEPFDELVVLEDLNISNNKRWIFFHDIEELATAVKPFAFSYFLRRSDVESVFI